MKHTSRGDRDRIRPLAAVRGRQLAAMVLALALPGRLPAVDETDLARYGFSGGFAGKVTQSRRFDLPAPASIPEPAVPTAVVPGDLLDPRQIPGAPEYVTRVIQQRQDAPTPGVEGPVAVFPGEEHARREEGTFKEVEDFFLRPTQMYRKIHSMNETGYTGLVNMATAEIPRPGATFARVGFGYTYFDRFSGTALDNGQAIEQFTAPITYQSIPWKHLELSLQVMGVNEEARNFPLIPDYDVGGVREVGLNAKYRFLDNPKTGVQAAFGFGMKIGVERLPTRLGSNAVDYQFFLAATKRIHNFGVHGRGGFTFPNGESRTNSGVPEIGELDLGIDFSPSDRLSFSAELNYRDWRFVGTNVEAAIGLKYRMTEKWSFDFGIPLELDNNLVEGYKYRVLTAVQVQL